MVYFQTKNPNLGKLWSALDWKMLIHFMAFWNILVRFGKCLENAIYIVNFGFIWHIFPVFGIMYKEKSGNPGCCSTLSPRYTLSLCICVKTQHILPG
jgi:hypothetical protein